MSPILSNTFKQLIRKSKLLPVALHNGQEDRYSCWCGCLLFECSLAPQMVSEAISEHLNQTFLGEHAPDSFTFSMLSTHIQVIQIWWLGLCWPLTSTYWVHSNVYGLGDIHCITYLTVVDPFHSTSSALQMYRHLTSTSEDNWLTSWTEKPTFIGKIPVPYGIPHVTSIIRRLATISVVS